MNIVLIGYGKMGRTIESIAIERGHTIVGKIDKDNAHELLKFNSSNADVAIEFTTPETALANLKTCFSNKLPVVCGTTGWLTSREEAIKACHENGTGFLYASNFSVGVNLFFKLNEWLAKLMAPHSNYSVSIEEVHHTEKKDAPSGTAITLAEDIVKQIPSIHQWSLSDGRPSSGVLPIKAVREPHVPGTHTISYSSDVDTIEIVHKAKSRHGFALGAVVAAEFLKGKKGVFSMEDVIKGALS